MKFIKKIKTEKIKKFFKKLPRILAERALLIFLGGIFFSLLLGALIFYQYGILALKEIPVIEKPLEFNREVHQAVLNEWQRRNERFLKTDLKKYPNPFQPALVKEEPIEEEKKLTEERIQELLVIPFVQELLMAANLYQFYLIKGEEFLLIEERAQIWKELSLGQAKEYQGTYYQNIKLLQELKKELTE